MNRLTELPEDFARLNLPEPLEHAILDLGFQTTTPVQAQVLPHSLDGADIIAQAQTGRFSRAKSSGNSVKRFTSLIQLLA